MSRILSGCPVIRFLYFASRTPPAPRTIPPPQGGLRGAAPPCKRLHRFRPEIEYFKSAGKVFLLKEVIMIDVQRQ